MTQRGWDVGMLEATGTAGQPPVRRLEGRPRLARGGSPAMVVLKFGGSSVGTAAALSRLASIVEAERRARVVIVSALGGATDELLAIAGAARRGDLDDALGRLEALRERHASMAAMVRDTGARNALLADLDAGWLEVNTLARAAALLKACAPPVADAIAARGELASSRLVAAVLADAGLPAAWVDARRVVVTDDRHQHASPAAGATAVRLDAEVRPLVGRGEIPVIGGFVGATAGGATTTLGRGGSDYSAALIAAGLGADEIQIWTDVDGMLTADPRIFGRPRAVDRLSFGEASALAAFGAKVLHPSTVRPAVEAGIPVRILNSRRPAGRGTLIAEGPARRPGAAAGIACLRDLCALDVPLPDGAGRPAALAAVYAACARAEAAVHLTAVSDGGVSVIVGDGAAGDRAAAQLSADSRLTRRRGLALVAIVGDGLAAGPGAGARVLAALDAIPLHLVSRTPGPTHVACVVDQANLARAVEALHEALFDHGHSAEGDGPPAIAPVPSLSRFRADSQEIRA